MQILTFREIKRFGYILVFIFTNTSLTMKIAAIDITPFLTATKK